MLVWGNPFDPEKKRTKRMQAGWVMIDWVSSFKIHVILFYFIYVYICVRLCTCLGAHRGKKGHLIDLRTLKCSDLGKMAASLFPPTLLLPLLLLGSVAERTPNVSMRL